MSMYMTYRTYENKPKELPEEKEKIETKKKQFAMYIKQGDNYVEYHGTDENENLFPEGYKLNEEQSRCEDIDGNKIDDISFDTNTNSITVTSNKTAYCYLYFDKKPPENPQEIIETRTSDEGLSDDLVGGMYRYIGTNDVVKNNYICLKTVGSAGCTTSGNDDNMYRIIGITKDGNIKVIKQIRYQKGSTYTFVWNSKSSVDKSSIFYCGTPEGCPTWEQSDMYNTLNEGSNSFLNGLDSTIKVKIEPQKWYYGDIGKEYMESQTSETIYKIESGQEATQYYNLNGTLVPKSAGTKWQQTSEKSSIGLMYVSDYLYAISSTGHTNNCRSDYTNCKESWIHETNNDNNKYPEWSMTRMGRDGNLSTYYYAWAVDADGFVEPYDFTYGFAVRPVFYLSSNIELGGAGSRSNPFYIVK